MKRNLLLAVVAACGSPAATAIPDAPPDVPSDSPPVDPGRITVHAPYADANNRITPGATVLFYDGHGALLDRVVTGADGQAVGKAGPGATVMVLPPAAMPGEYYTWVGASPGDELTTTRAPAAAAVTPSDHHVSVTTRRHLYSQPATYSLGTVGLSASQLVQPGTDDITFDATRDANAPLVDDVVVQYKDQTSTAFQVKHAVSFDTGVIDLRSASWGIGDTYSATMALPSTVHWVTAYHKTLSAGRVLWQDLGTVDWSVVPTALSFVVPAAGDGAALTVDYGDGVSTYALSYNAPPAELSWQQASPTADNVDLASGNSASWFPPAMLGPEQGVVLTLTGANARWHIVMPPDQMSFTPPPFPSDLVAPPAMDQARVSYAGGNDPGGYVALRADPDVFDLYHWAQVLPATSGVYRFGGR